MSAENITVVQMACDVSHLVDVHRCPKRKIRSRLQPQLLCALAAVWSTFFVRDIASNKIAPNATNPRLKMHSQKVMINVDGF